MAPQSGVFPIYLRAEYRDDGQGLSRFQSEAARVAAQAKREFQGVAAAFESALSRPRNTGGSLDLGVDELRQAAIAQQQIAAAARQVAEATNRARAATDGYDAALSKSTAAAFRFASAEEAKGREMLEQVALLDRIQAELNQTVAATDAVTAANRRGTTAQSNVINSTRASRTAFIQLGQQMQDVAVQAQLGTSAFVIFGQQAPQAFFALTGLADSANRTQAAIGRFATFMSGPFGAAIFVAVAALGPLIAKLFESAEEGNKLTDALDKAKFAADGMSSAQSILGNVIDLTTGKMRDQTDAAVTLARAQLQLAEVRSRVAANEARTTLQTASQRTVQTNIASAGVGSFGGTVFRSVRSPTVSAAAAQRALNGDVDGALNDLKAAVDAGRTTAAIYAETATAIANLGVETENIKRFGEALKALEGDQNALGQFRRTSGGSGRSSSGGGGSSAREAERLATFGEKAAESIQRINERFDEQPRLIDQGKQATRQLETIIGDVNKRLAEGKNLTAAQRAELEKIKKAAEDTKPVIEKAMVAPVEELLRNSEDRLRIEELIAQGRVDEAVVLQEILRLEQQFGEQSEADLKRIRDQVLFEQQRTRELRVQAELMELQADVARSVADSLRDLFSGRGSFGDLIRNFRQSLADLQGARLFEDLFGPAFQQLEEELRGNTPQGRANARATKEIETFADTGRRAGNAVTAFADVIERVTARIAANDNPAIGAAGAAAGRSISGAGSAFAAALAATGVGGITVTGDRKQEVEIGRTSAKDIADRVAKATVEGFLGPLEDVLGPRFMAGLSGVLTGALSGFIQGGKVGGVLGGLQGITALIPGLGGVSEGFGALGQGAAIGNQIAGITKALGIGGSSTGAAIGGALGTPFGPAGQIVGSILGNVVGGLLKSPKRGSATIGGVGGSLGITGTVGNSAALRDTANTLAGSVLESVNRIAQQLGARVDASAGAVSIGQRKDNLRVDPSGRGATKIGNGAIDFGQDSEAAIAFAVQNLIQDGVIKGLRASENRLLQAGKDINAALQDVLTFRSVFDRLKEIKDPLGFAIDTLNREFEGLIDLFTRAGASTEEFAQLEELYNLQRAEAIKDATDRVAGSLKQLLNDLKIGDSGLSLRDRQANALGQFNSLAARVAAGDSSAFDEFADISKQLLDIERQLFGSTQSYFDRLSQVTSLTEQAIAGQTNVTSIGSARPSPFDDAPVIDRSIRTMDENLGAKLDAINFNLIALNSQNSPRPVSGSGFGAEIYNNALRIANF